MEKALVDVGDVLVLVVPKLSSRLRDEPHLLVKPVGLHLDRQHRHVIKIFVNGREKRAIRHLNHVLAKPSIRLVQRHCFIPLPYPLVVLIHLCDYDFDIIVVHRALIGIRWTAKVADYAICNRVA